MTRLANINAQRPALFLSILIVTTMQTPFVFSRPQASPALTVSEEVVQKQTRTPFQEFSLKVIGVLPSNTSAEHAARELSALEKPLTALLKIAPASTPLHDELATFMTALLSIPRNAVGIRRMEQLHETILMAFTTDIARRGHNTSARMQEHAHQYLHEIQRFFDPSLVITQKKSSPASTVLKWAGISVATVAAAAALTWAARSVYTRWNTPEAPAPANSDRGPSHTPRSVTRAQGHAGTGKPISRAASQLAPVSAPAPPSKTVTAPPKIPKLLVTPVESDKNPSPPTVSHDVSDGPGSTVSALSDFHTPLSSTPVAGSTTSTPHTTPVTTGTKTLPRPGDTGWRGHPTPTPIPFSLGTLTPGDDFSGTDRIYDVIEHNDLNAEYVSENYNAGIPIAYVDAELLNKLFELERKKTKSSSNLKVSLKNQDRMQILHNAVLASLLARMSKDEKITFFKTKTAKDIAFIAPRGKGSISPKINSRGTPLCIDKYIELLDALWSNDPEQQGALCRNEREVQQFINRRISQNKRILGLLRQILNLKENGLSKDDFKKEDTKEAEELYRQTSSMVEITSIL